MPERYVIFDATAHKNPEGEPAGVHLCTSEKEALGFAVGKLHCGHAVQEIRERGDSELFKRADTAAIEAALLRIEAAECRRGAVGKSVRAERTLLALAERLESEATSLEARGSG
jgi:hypothetical protein